MKGDAALESSSTGGETAGRDGGGGGIGDMKEKMQRGGGGKVDPDKQRSSEVASVDAGAGGVVQRPRDGGRDVMEKTGVPKAVESGRGTVDVKGEVGGGVVVLEAKSGRQTGHNGHIEGPGEEVDEEDEHSVGTGEGSLDGELAEAEQLKKEIRKREKKLRKERAKVEKERVAAEAAAIAAVKEREEHMARGAKKGGEKGDKAEGGGQDNHGRGGEKNQNKKQSESIGADQKRGEKGKNKEAGKRNDVGSNGIMDGEAALAKVEDGKGKRGKESSEDVTPKPVGVQDTQNRSSKSRPVTPPTPHSKVGSKSTPVTPLKQVQVLSVGDTNGMFEAMDEKQKQVAPGLLSQGGKVGNGVLGPAARKGGGTAGRVALEKEAGKKAGRVGDNRRGQGVGDAEGMGGAWGGWTYDVSGGANGVVDQGTMKEGFNLSALLQQQLEKELHSRQDESRSKRLRPSSSPDHSHSNPNLNPSNDFALPAAAARAAARVFQMAADLSLDDQGLRERLSGMRNAAMSALAGGGGGVGSDAPEPHRILEAATSAERAVHAAALWEESLRAKHSGVAMTEQQMEFLLGSEGYFHHSPHLTQVECLEREVASAREVERVLEHRLKEVKEWIDLDNAILEGFAKGPTKSESII